jgi:glyoxylase-like metal-dependent hydrolase (beta-lactamase superfamily II)
VSPAATPPPDVIRPSNVDVVRCRRDNPRGIVKCFVVHTADQVVLIDSGFEPADVAHIAEALDLSGHVLADVSACVLTHSHRDHVGGLRRLVQLSGCEVIAHRLDAPKVETVGEVAVSRTVNDGDVLDYCGGIDVIHVPGHSPGSIALYVGASHSLFAGDSLFSGGGHLMPSPDYLSDNPRLAQDSARALARLPWPVDNVFVAHGDEVIGIGQRNLERLLSERREF